MKVGDVVRATRDFSYDRMAMNSSGWVSSRVGEPEVEICAGDIGSVKAFNDHFAAVFFWRVSEITIAYLPQHKSAEIELVGEQS